MDNSSDCELGNYPNHGHAVLGAGCVENAGGWQLHDITAAVRRRSSEAGKNPEF